jgi:hypothetical protein
MNVPASVLRWPAPVDLAADEEEDNNDDDDGGLQDPQEDAWAGHAVAPTLPPTPTSEPDPAAMATAPPLRALLPPRVCAPTSAGSVPEPHHVALAAGRAHWRRQQCLAAVQWQLARATSSLLGGDDDGASGAGADPGWALVGVPAMASVTGPDRDVSDWVLWHAIEQAAVQRGRPVTFRCHRRPGGALLHAEGGRHDNDDDDNAGTEEEDGGTSARVHSCDDAEVVVAAAARAAPDPTPWWMRGDRVLVLAPPIDPATRAAVRSLRTLLQRAAAATPAPPIVVFASTAAELELLGRQGTCSLLRAPQSGVDDEDNDKDDGGGRPAAASVGVGVGATVVWMPSAHEAAEARRQCPSLPVRALPHPLLALSRATPITGAMPVVDILFLLRDRVTARALRRASGPAAAVPAGEEQPASDGGLFDALARLRTAKLSFEVRFLRGDADWASALRERGQRLPRALPRARYQLLVDAVARGGVVVSDDVAVVMVAALLGRPFVTVPPRQRPAGSPWAGPGQYRGQDDDVRSDVAEVLATALAWARLPPAGWTPACARLDAEGGDGGDGAAEQSAWADVDAAQGAGVSGGCLGRAALANVTAVPAALRTLLRQVDAGLPPWRDQHDLGCTVASLGGAVVPATADAPWAWAEAARAALLLAKDRDCGHRAVFSDRRIAFQVADHYRDAMATAGG